jgi:hypothetical protein
MNTLYNKVEVLRNAGEHLIPYNFPLNHKSLEDNVGIFKNSICDVDGYTVHLHFSRADYGEHYLETCQINGEYTPFLPFNLVIKIGQIFLGSYYLSFIDTTRQGKKYYCWTVCVDKVGHPIPWQYSTKMYKKDYDGFSYNEVSPNEIKFH